MTYLLNIAYKVANAELLHNLSFTKSNQLTDHDCDNFFKIIFTLDPYWASYPAVQGRKQKPVGRAKGRTESGVHTRTECCKSVFQSSSCELLSQILRNLLLVVVT